MSAPHWVIPDLLPLVRRFVVGGYGVAIGGSYVKGSSDPLSDLDIYIFADRVLPAPRRAVLVVDALGADARPESWGADDPFVQGGTDFWHDGRRVECWLRSASEVERTLQECLRGEIRREYLVWTVMGFVNHAVLGDVRSMRIVEDPHGMLARWKQAVATYPEPLREKILGRFTAEAAFWPENFHYRTAVQRADGIYTSGIVQQVVHALIQVVFALNREYFPGEKRLAHAMERLRVQPRDFAHRVQQLLFPGRADAASLDQQRRGLSALVAETRELVAAEG